jgi:hypothetical protein
MARTSSKADAPTCVNETVIRRTAVRKNLKRIASLLDFLLDLDRIRTK